MVTKLVVTILIGLFIILRLKSALNTPYGDVSQYVKIPYFQLFLIAVIFTIGIDLLNALLLKVFAGVFGGSASVSAMINVVGARAMYDCIFIIVGGILGLLSLPAGIFVSALAAVLTPYIEYGGLQGCGNLSEDRVAYAFFVTKNLYGHHYSHSGVSAGGRDNTEPDEHSFITFQGAGYGKKGSKIDRTYDWGDCGRRSGM